MLQLAGRESQAFTVPAHDVWAYRLDFANLPAYNPNVSGIALLREGSVSADLNGFPSRKGDRYGEGTTWAFTLTTPRGPSPVTLTVTSVVEDEMIAADLTGAMSAHEVFTVEPNESGGCTALLVLSLDIPSGTDAMTIQTLLDGGRREIRAELDAMAELLGSPPVS